MNKFDIIIEKGLILDGSGRPPFCGDVGILNGIITQIGDLEDKAASERINADCLYVAPGFIDAHCHTDVYAMAFPSAEGKLMQGVTTDVCGLCGSSAAPIGKGSLARYKTTVSPIAGEVREISFAEYAGLINTQGNTTNMAMFVGNANLRIHAMGYYDRAATGDELQVMKEMLRKAMEEGALGLSTGLTYVPSQFADINELSELCRVIAPYGGIYNSHMRNESDRVEESVAEVIEIAGRSGCRGHISHLKASGRANFGKSEKCLTLIEQANQAGIRVSFDVYPYTASSVSLISALPGWVRSVGFGDDFAVFRSKENLRKIEADIARSDWDNIILSCGYGSIFIGDGNGCSQYEGKSLSQIAGELGTDELSALIRVVEDSRGLATIICHGMSEDDLRAFIKSPYCVIGTDAYARHYEGPTAAGKPHPRNYGAFPRFIRRYAAEQKLLSAEEAVHKITGLPAQLFGIEGRGFIKQGYAADIVVFDIKSLGEGGDYSSPNVPPGGIKYVLLNGKPALDNGKFKDIRAGRFILPCRRA